MDDKNKQLFEACAAVLAANDRGDYTVPAGDLYPHQWLWDSCFIAIGLAHIDPTRAKKELISLVRGQWANGMLDFAGCQVLVETKVDFARIQIGSQILNSDSCVSTTAEWEWPPLEWNAVGTIVAQVDAAAQFQLPSIQWQAVGQTAIQGTSAMSLPAIQWHATGIVETALSALASWTIP